MPLRRGCCARRLWKRKSIIRVARSDSWRPRWAPCSATAAIPTKRSRTWTAARPPRADRSQGRSRARVCFYTAKTHYRMKRRDEALDSLQCAVDLAYQAGIDQFLIVSGIHALPLLRYATRRLNDPRIERLLARIETFRQTLARAAEDDEIAEADHEPTPALEIRARVGRHLPGWPAPQPIRLGFGAGPRVVLLCWIIRTAARNKSAISSGPNTRHLA